jgi:hypothetical protein
MEINTMEASPAAGPLTLIGDLLRAPTTIPPTTPATTPENKGAPEASAMPRHSGNATKKTTIDAGTSAFKLSFNSLKLFCFTTNESINKKKQLKQGNVKMGKRSSERYPRGGGETISMM